MGSGSSSLLRTRRRLRRDEGGQLMLLAGIVITIAFLLTSMTLSQVASLERQAAAEKPAPMAAEWRFLHERLATNVESAVPPDLPLATFKDTTFPIIANTFRSIEAEKGFDVIIRLADDRAKFNKSELDLTAGGLGVTYDAWDADGEHRFTAAYDGVNDGVVRYATCPDAEYAGACIVGVLVYVKMTDGTTTMSEVILFSVNTG